MRLPNAELAIVELDKWTEYCLNPHHPRGRHKARVFESALGLRRDDAPLLRDALVDAEAKGDAVISLSGEYGERSLLDFEMSGPSGPVVVRSLWIVLAGESIPRLVSCYVRDGGGTVSMDAAVSLYDVVARTSDVPDQGLVRGQTGTVVLVHQPGVYEVEFCDDDGHTYALLPLRADQLMVLHHERVAV